MVKERYAANIFTTIETGEVLMTQLSALRKPARLTSINTVIPRRGIAAAIIDTEDTEKYFC